MSFCDNCGQIYGGFSCDKCAGTSQSQRLGLDDQTVDSLILVAAGVVLLLALVTACFA